MFIKNSQSTIINLFCLLVIAMSFTACEKEDPIPTITQLKVCESAPASEILCSSTQSTFQMTAPGFHTSAVFNNITKSTPVSFTLYGKDAAGNWISIFDKRFTPSEGGTFDDETVFNLSTDFTKGSTQLWPSAEYKIEAQIEATEGASAEVRFSVQ